MFYLHIEWLLLFCVRSLVSGILYNFNYISIINIQFLIIKWFFRSAAYLLVLNYRCICMYFFLNLISIRSINSINLLNWITPKTKLFHCSDRKPLLASTPFVLFGLYCIARENKPSTTSYHKTLLWLSN